MLKSKERKLKKSDLTNNLWVVCGCSPFVSTLDINIVQHLISTYPSIGINGFPVFIKGCKYWTFMDIETTKWVNIHHTDEILIFPEQCESYLPNLKEYWGYIFTPHSYPVRELNNKLYTANNSSMPAINYALVNGATNILLLGIDIPFQWTHFYDGREIPIADSTIHHIRKAIYEFKPYVRLLSLNPDTELQLDIIKLEEIYDV